MSVGIEYARTQWAGGQGFFHSGTVTAGGGGALYVYDCGSLSPTTLSREIQEFQKRHGRVIDLLFLSHFHADHVNGLPELLRLTAVRTAVIPLVPTAERLYVLGSALSGEAPITDWYQRLIVDPTSAIREIGGDIDIVVVEPVTEGEDDPSTYRDEPPSSEPPIDGAPGSDPSKSVTLSAGKRSTLSEANGFQPIWEWGTMTTAFAKNATRAFLKNLANRLQVSVVELEILISTGSGVADLVANRSEELREAYRDSFPDLNLTSLIVYSGPAKEVLGPGRTYRSRSFVERGELHAWDARPGWLGTGDQRMGSRRCSAVEKHFGARLSRVGTLALPHHGSSGSYAQTLLSIFGGYRPICALSVGIDSIYGHPDRRVVIDVSSNGNHVVIVTEDESSRWTESGVFYL